LEDNQDSTTNFACIYLNNNKIDCDNAKHDITPEEVMCKPIDGGKKNCPENDSWSVPVTCESS
jgi:hypothetical protein